MKKISFIPFIIMLGCMTTHQTNNPPLSINTLKVYADNTQKGYTTAGAFTHFNDMIEEGPVFITISEEDRMRFEQVLNNAEQNKHYQTKFGGNLLFCEMRIDTKSTIQKVVITGEYNVYNKFGKIKEKRVLITNLTTMEEYKITNSLDLIWISGFFDRIKLMSEMK